MVAVVLAMLGLVAPGCGGSAAEDGEAPSTVATPSTTASSDGGAETEGATGGGLAEDGSGEGDETGTGAGAVEADPSAGCGREPDVATVSTEDAPGDVAQQISVGGTDWTYRLAVPAGYDPDEAVPLILNLHGAGSDGLQAGVYSDIPHAASERGMLVVAPDAIDGRWELAGDGADAAFLDALVDDVEGRYCVDRRRVHVVGMSLGAFKAATTACGSDRYASAALVTVEVHPGRCDPLPVVAFHGTADAVAPYGPGGTAPDPEGPNAGITGALVNMDAWAESGGCAPEAHLDPVGEDVVRHTFPGCQDGVDVVFYSIEGGGHTWPGSAITIGPPALTTQTIDATALILDWFEAHPLRP